MKIRFGSSDCPKCYAPIYATMQQPKEHICPRTAIEQNTFSKIIPNELKSYYAYPNG